MNHSRRDDISQHADHLHTLVAQASDPDQWFLDVAVDGARAFFPGLTDRRGQFVREADAQYAPDTRPQHGGRLVDLLDRIARIEADAPSPDQWQAVLDAAHALALVDPDRV